MLYAPNLQRSHSTQLRLLGFLISEVQCRFGFNSRGVDYVAENLANFRKRQSADPERARGGLVGVNLGKNKTSEDPAGDFVIGISKLGIYADYVVINVSSPNTPGNPYESHLLYLLPVLGPKISLIGSLLAARLLNFLQVFA